MWVLFRYPRHHKCTWAMCRLIQAERSQQLCRHIPILLICGAGRCAIMPSRIVLATRALYDTHNNYIYIYTKQLVQYISYLYICCMQGIYNILRVQYLLYSTDIRPYVSKPCRDTSGRKLIYIYYIIILLYPQLYIYIHTESIYVLTLCIQ